MTTSIRTNSAPLTDQQREQFHHDGYLLLRNAVPTDVLATATRAINASVGQGMNVSDMPTFRSRSYCPELTSTPLITDLFTRSTAWPAAEKLIGEGRLLPLRSGQIALRFPTAVGTVAREPNAHIDGMYTPTNGVQKGSIDNFTALGGVFLSSVPGDNCGNLTVWPGSHERYAAYFRERGAEALLDGMPPVDIGSPVQVKAEPGDAIIAHFLLGHGVASNTSPHIRYACFFRLKTQDHDRLRWETMQDPWLDWNGMA